MVVKPRYLFISHSWTYGTAYDGLVTLLEKAPRFEYRNYSVPQDDPVHHAPTDMALRRAILQKMTPCQVVIVIAGVYATYSKWINIELDLAKSHFNKPVLAVRPWAAKRTSVVVRDAADLIVGWNTKSIVGAIRRLAP